MNRKDVHAKSNSKIKKKEKRKSSNKLYIIIFAEIITVHYYKAI